MGEEIASTLALRSRISRRLPAAVSAIVGMPDVAASISAYPVDDGGVVF